MNLVADESVDQGITELLEQAGLNIYSITRHNQGITDIEVLNIAVKKNVLLITEDKDFGELTIRLKKTNSGIVLIRANHLTLDKRASILLKTLETFKEELKQYLTVIDDESLVRMRKLEV